MSETLRLRAAIAESRPGPERGVAAGQAAQAYGQVQNSAMPGQRLAAGKAGRASRRPLAGMVASSGLWAAATALLLGGIVVGGSLTPGPRPIAATSLQVTPPRSAQALPAAPLSANPTAAAARLPKVILPVPETQPESREALAPPPPPVLPQFDVPESQASAEDVPAPVVEPQKLAAALPVPAPVSVPVPSAAMPATVAPKEQVRPQRQAALPLPVPQVGNERWRQLAVPVPAGAKAPFIAIVIDDMGLDRRNSARAVSLTGPLTLSYMSYAPDLAEQTSSARRMGHELMLHLPMEPLDARRNNPGPNALLVQQDESEWRKRLAWSLDRFDGYAGVNNHMGSRFTADLRGMSVVMDELQKRGVFWLDSHTGPRSAGPAEAARFGMASAGRDVFLDDERDAGGVAAQLAITERIALANGDAIAIGHPHGATLDALARWIPQARQRGFTLVPVSAVVQRRLEHRRS